MNFYNLEKNITDIIEEQQLKLGYLEEMVRLYYPLSSLNNFLEVECNVDEMKVLLTEFSEKTRGSLGGITVSSQDERFCIGIPQEGTKNVYNHLNKNGFLAQLIDVVRKHGCTIDEVLEIFYSYSDKLHVEQVSNGEFDYLVYFEDGKPDDYRYCFSLEGEHVIYHRFTPKDYEDFGF